MSASSVTGRGLGDSHGKYKSDNQCGGCNCGCKDCEKPSVEIPKETCYTKLSVGTNVASVFTGKNSSIKVC